MDDRNTIFGPLAAKRRIKSYFEMSWFKTTSKNLKSLLDLQSFPLDPDIFLFKAHVLCVC